MDNEFVVNKINDRISALLSQLEFMTAGTEEHLLVCQSVAELAKASTLLQKI